METNTYTSLMERRVRRILLVCNNYDSFALEEDGRIDVQIAQEYAELNLSNPPSITRAETTDEALEHLSSTLSQGEGASPLEREVPDLVILENVGNLVCPAEFDTGAVKNAMILSVPEGHDKPLKYPLMFSICDVVVINKMDVLPYFDFDLEKCKEYIHMRNPKATVIPICAKTGEGVEAFAEWLLKEVSEWKA